MKLEIQEDMALASLTTLGVGGKARFFCRAETEEQVGEAVGFARNRDLPLFVVGGGSNLVISDRGWDGVVLQIGIAEIHEKSSEDKIHFDVDAGVDWDQFVAHAVSLNCAGIECLSGIPGSVGGTPVQNVGAYGQEVSQTIRSVRALDLAKNQIRELNAAECGFGYRTSIFNTSQRERYVILRVTYALKPNGTPSLRYADLQKYFAGRQDTPTLRETREAVRQIRASKGMLITPGDPDSKSAGSFFKNPVLSPSQHDDLLRRAAARNLQVPSFPALSNQHKISGFKKGHVKGHTGISSKHALAIVNRGGASAAEIITLRDEIQCRVEQVWGILLETEPVFVGF
jgi:UDP-N-acetylmuramate dehydrogenase